MKNLVTDLTQRSAVKFVRILYPIWIVVGMFSMEYVPTTLIVSGDALATANNILANELLFRMGIFGSLVEPIIFVLAGLALFTLLKPVSKNHAKLMVVFILLSVPITMLSALGKIAALFVISGADYLNVFSLDQLQSLMMLCLDLSEKGISIATVFWGLWLFPLGYLVYCSGYFPKAIGVVVVLAGFGFLLNPFTQLLFPSYKESIIPILDILTMGELLFILWLVIRGAKIPQAGKIER